jgi:hypothetical protein
MATAGSRIAQVASRRATRITSDEEERQRQGYEMITTLRFAAENGKPRRLNKLRSRSPDLNCWPSSVMKRSLGDGPRR